MTAKELNCLLKDLNACIDAIKWSKGKSLEEAWRECPRGDWLLWLAAGLRINQKLLVSAACACARTALRNVPEGEDRPRIAIETAEAWTRGEATPSEVQSAAANAALGVAYDADVSVSVYAARAASDAAYFAARAAYITSADDAADFSAASAALAADAADADDLAALKGARKEMADIVRSIIPFDFIREAAKGIDQ